MPSNKRKQKRIARLNYLLNNHTLDWVSLFQPHSLHTEKERRSKLSQLISTLETFFILDFSTLTTGKEAELESKCKCIKLYINRQRSLIQFRGLFFLTHQENSLKIIERVFKELLHNIFPSVVKTKLAQLKQRKASEENKWRVTRIDIMRNTLNTQVEKAFPIHQDKTGVLNGDKGLHWSMNCSPQPFFNKNILTGITHKLRDASITTYNKSTEVKAEKSLRKRALFNEHYCVGEDDEITRIELRLDKKVKCSDLTDYLKSRSLGLTPPQNEETIIEAVLNRFSQKNRIYIIDKKQKNKRKWKLEPRFKAFITTKKEYKKVKSISLSLDATMKPSQALNRAISTIVNILLRKRCISELQSKDKGIDKRIDKIGEMILNLYKQKKEVIKDEDNSSRKAGE